MEPRVEAQAIDRSHRIGQTRTVNAYKLITPAPSKKKSSTSNNATAYRRGPPPNS